MMTPQFLISVLINLHIPEDVHYDGIEESLKPGATVLHFTDLAPGPSKGASFCVQVNGLNRAAFLRKLAEFRESFAPKPIRWDERETPAPYEGPNSIHA